MTIERRRSWLAAGAAVALPLAAAALLLLARGHVDNRNIALALVVPVVGVAMLERRSATLASAVWASILFDFFHTRPYHSFTIRSSDDVLTAGLLLIVGVAVGELAIRGQQHRALAIQHENDITRIHSIAELVADGEKAAFVVIAVARELSDVLVASDVRFEAVPIPLDEKPMAVIERTGDVRIGELAWGADSMGLPGPTALVVQGGGRVWGRYVVTPTPGVPASFERRIVAVALADQAGAALATSNSVLG